MNEKRIDFLGILFWVIIVVLFGSILINLLRETPTDTQVYLAFFTGLLMIVSYTLLLIMNYLTKLNREFEEVKAKVDEIFKKLRNVKVKKRIIVKNL